mgnify:CR=1 FL=1
MVKKQQLTLSLALKTSKQVSENSATNMIMHEKKIKEYFKNAKIKRNNYYICKDLSSSTNNIK